MKIVCLSDTHGLHNKITVPKCDILVHSGDWTNLGKKEEVEDFAKWLDNLNADEILITPGNHEVFFERNYPESKEWTTKWCPRAKILIDESINVGGLNFYFSPWTPSYGFGWAYNAARSEVESAHIFKPYIKEIWDKIPQNVNFLVTHGMPLGVLDLANNQHVGDKYLLHKILSLKELKYVQGGHLHFCGGKTEKLNDVLVINAAICNESYKPVNKIIELNYEI